jgi:uncharacterized protein (DUF1684 family)
MDASSSAESLEHLWDWRRQIADLYGALRSGADAAPGADLAWARWRACRDRLYAEHSQTPLPPERRAVFAGLPYYAYDPRFRFEVDLVPVEAGSWTTIELAGDGLLRFRPFARTLGLAQGLGGELTLYWIGGYGGGVFLPFRDATTGRGTYGGGRYLLDTIKGADLGQRGGRTLLDFNFAYNPSCSYSDRWVCPLAPVENTVPARIEAGEMAP